MALSQNLETFLTSLTLVKDKYKFQITSDQEKIRDPDPENPVCPLVSVFHERPEALEDLTVREKKMVIDTSDNLVNSSYFNPELRERILKALQGGT